MNFIRKLNFNIRYLMKPPWDSGISPPELIQFLENNPPGKALDIGCGTGTNALTMTEYGWDVTGIDFAYLAIIKARIKARRSGKIIYFENADLVSYNLGLNKYDLILDLGCSHSIHHNIRKILFPRIKCALKSDGDFLLYAFISDTQEDSKPGISNEDLEILHDEFLICDYVDGIDDTGRKSAWFWLKPKLQTT